jgi:hypothetical protein
LLHLLTAVPGTKRPFYGCRRMSVHGGKAVVPRNSDMSGLFLLRCTVL